MGIFSAIGSFISGVCSVVSSICSAIGLGAIGNLLTVAITALNPLLGLILAALPLVCKILESLAPKEVDPEEIESGELAVKAEVCQDIKSENYKTYSEYIKAVREEVARDPSKRALVDEKMKNRTEVDENAHKMVSIAMAGKIISEKLDIDYVDPILLGKLNACGFDADKTVKFFKESKDLGLSTTNISKYFDRGGGLSTKDYERADENIRAALGKVDPSLKTDEQRIVALNGMHGKINDALSKDQAVKNIENASS